MTNGTLASMTSIEGPCGGKGLKCRNSKKSSVSKKVRTSM